jgi:hypothetical protein
MATGEGSTPEEPELPGPEGLLFTGDFIQTLTREQLAKLGEVASAFGVDMRPVRSAEQGLGGVPLSSVEDEQVTPVPMRQKDFKTFAARHGFPAHTAVSAWYWVTDESVLCAEGERPGSPAIAVTGSKGNLSVELNSLYGYLSAALERHGVSHASERQEAFLLALLNQTLQPDRPLVSRRFSR